MLTILVFAMAGTLRADDIVTHWNKVMGESKVGAGIMVRHSFSSS